MINGVDLIQDGRHSYLTSLEERMALTRSVLQISAHPKLIQLVLTRLSTSGFKTLTMKPTLLANILFDGFYYNSQNVTTEL